MGSQSGFFSSVLTIFFQIQYDDLCRPSLFSLINSTLLLAWSTPNQGQECTISSYLQKGALQLHVCTTENELHMISDSHFSLLIVIRLISAHKHSTSELLGVREQPKKVLLPKVLTAWVLTPVKRATARPCKLTMSYHKKYRQD